MTQPGGKKVRGGASKSDSQKSGGTLRLRWAVSAICAPKDQKATIRGLGFRRLGQRVVREDTPAVRGMVRKVQHLVEIEG
jgi:large subunit ribosomal protein L30